MLVSQVYEHSKSSDGFLYVIYTKVFFLSLFIYLFIVLFVFIILFA